MSLGYLASQGGIAPPFLLVVPTFTPALLLSAPYTRKNPYAFGADLATKAESHKEKANVMMDAPTPAFGPSKRDIPRKSSGRQIC